MEEIGVAQGMTKTGKVYTPGNLGGTSKEAAPKLHVVETGIDDLWRKIQAREYSVVDHLNKTPAQISILSLLQNLDMHKNALMKVLSEAYVLAGITSGEMANMVGQVLESHKITFHEDELPPEGRSHNWALHITVQFEDKFITRVLIDGGSSLNICPLTTLKILGKGLHDIRIGSMNVKAFNGSQRAIIGEINLDLQMAGAVASTLHQTVKFEWNHQEVIIHGDGSNPLYTNQTVPIIENKRNLGRETYHCIERVNAIEKDRWWSKKIESILSWTGYEPSKGFGKKLHGITKPVQLQYHSTTFGLGYEYTWQKYQDWTPPWRAPYYPLEQPVPPLHQTFHQADIIWGSEEDEVLASIRKLFLDEEDMDCSAIVEDGEEDLTIQTMEEGVVLKTWTVAPSRARQDPGIIITYPDEPTIVTCNKTTQHKDNDSEDLEDHIIPEEIVKIVENFENKPKSNMKETEAVNLGNSEIVKETRISIHLSSSEKEGYIRFLKEYEDIFAWSYDDMTGQHDETGRKEQAIYYLSKKFTPYEACQKLRHYFYAYTTYLISRMDQLKYIFQKPMPTGKLAKWQILLSEFDIIYVTQKVVKGQALVDHLAENLVDGEYEPLKTYFPDEEVSFVGEEITEAYDGWRVFFDGVENFKGVGIRVVLVSETGQHYQRFGSISASGSRRMGYEEHQNIAILALCTRADQEVHKDRVKHIPRIQNEFADALASLSSIIQHPNKNFIDPIPIGIHKQLAYCAHVEEEIDENSWFHDTMGYLEKGEYP
ncbi:uncharacterized protein [Nicotiana tomentosiformis]|uniref:uncharacterized protein n=1 Tax=Nicotiana tomentosiformis TaxID=4098 RepID=UPI00388C586E